MVSLEQKVAELEERLREEIARSESIVIESETSAQVMEKRFNSVCEELQGRTEERNELVKERSELAEQLSVLTGDLTAIRTEKLDLERSFDMMRKERDEQIGLNRRFETLMESRRLELDQKDKTLDQYIQVSIILLAIMNTNYNQILFLPLVGKPLSLHHLHHTIFYPPPPHPLSARGSPHQGEGRHGGADECGFDSLYRGGSQSMPSRTGEVPL